MKSKTRKQALGEALRIGEQADAALAALGAGERPSRTQSNYLKTVQQLADAETDLTRAQNRWQKLRAKKARYEKRLDADFIRRAGGLGGKLDWRELAQDIIAEDGQ